MSGNAPRTGPRVLVVIPTMDRPSLLREAIQSVLVQTFRDFVVIVADNCSQQQTADVLRDFQDRRIIHDRSSTKLSISQNWSRCLTECDSEYIAFLCDDDLWLPGYLLSAVTAFETEPSVGLFSAGVERFGADTDVQMPAPYPGCQREISIAEQSVGVYRWLRGNPVLPSAAVVRRSALNEIGWSPANVEWGIDHFVFGHIALATRWAFDERRLVRYRVHSGMLTRTLLARRASSAQYRFVVGQLGENALRLNILDAERLLTETDSWSAEEVATVVIAFCDIRRSKRLREIGKRLWRVRARRILDRNGSSHARVARYVGDWYLAWAGTTGEIVSGWRPRSQEMAG